jgi:HTH-type transcriptional regulator/antitoxin HipB
MPTANFLQPGTWARGQGPGNFASTSFAPTPTMIAIHNSTDLGQATRAARKRLGLTQPQLALAAGVGVRFIVEMEAGKPSLRLSSVLQVLGALGGRLAVEGLEDELPAGSATALTAPPSKPARKID